MSNASAQSFDSVVRRALRAARVAVCAAASGAHDVIRLALPQRCELCAAPAGDTLLCPACSATLPRVRTACPVCALPSSDGTPCGACLRHPPPYAAAIAPLVYAFPVDRLLQQIKYGGRLALADWAGVVLAGAVRTALASRADSERPQCIVAMPLAPPRQRVRGFNQAREIAVRVARGTGLSLAAPLARIGDGPPQAALPWAARGSNVRGAFAVRGNVRGARIALVDDVMTTGATLGEAARTLARAGAARVECWVVARTLRAAQD